MPATYQRAGQRAAAADLQRVARRSTLLGSPTTQWSIFSPRCLQPFQQLDGAVDGDAFLVAGDQQGDRAFGLADARRSSAAATKQAMRPSCRRRRGHTACRPSRRRKTGCVPSLRPPAPHRYGRQSRNAARPCPAGHRDCRYRRRRLPRRCGDVEARVFQHRFQHASAPASAGVTDGQRIRAWARARASSYAAHSVPQQFVDGGLGAGLLVHPLDDHGAVQDGPARRSQRLARQRARHHHRIGRHLAHDALRRWRGRRSWSSADRRRPSTARCLRPRSRLRPLRRGRR